MSVRNEVDSVHDFGIRGGTSARQRIRIRKQRATRRANGDNPI